MLLFLKCVTFLLCRQFIILQSFLFMLVASVFQLICTWLFSIFNGLGWLGANVFDIYSGLALTLKAPVHHVVMQFLCNFI